MEDFENIKQQAQELYPQAVEFRRRIHSYPELSFAEYNTAEFIRSVLSRQRITYTSIAETGTLAKIECGGDLKNAVVLRADIDALPISEQTGLEYCSQNNGIMHACGHDLHTAALLYALILINRNRECFGGTVFGLFQPGEEVSPGGATLVLAENPFKDYNIIAFLGQHIEPELPTGVFGFRAGKYMASTDEVHVTVKGLGGHAAMPDKLRDPVTAAADFILQAKAAIARSANPAVPTVLSFGRVIADGSTNVVPDMVEIAGTFRTFDEKWRSEAKALIEGVAKAIEISGRVDVEVRFRPGYPSVVNDERLAVAAVEKIRDIFGRESAVSLDMRTTAEDFGFYTERYPSLFYRFGVGGGDASHDAGRLHTASLNPDEESLYYAALGMVGLAGLFSGKQ